MTFPALSVPVTVSVCVPTVDVSSGAPFAVDPTHEARPDSWSTHLNFAFTCLFNW